MIRMGKSIRHKWVKLLLLLCYRMRPKAATKKFQFCQLKFQLAFCNFSVILYVLE